MEFSLDGKTILVTGGSGSIGSALVRGLFDLNPGKIVVFSRDETKQFIMKRRLADDRLETVVGDVRNHRTIEDVLEKYRPVIVYHVAAMKHLTMCESFPLEAVSTNVIGTQNVVNMARRYDVSRLVNISTDKTVYPSTVLGSTKLIGERIVANAGYTSVRFGNVAGSRGSVIPVLTDEMLRHKRLTITDMRVTRFILTIEEAVHMILKATTLAAGGDTFLLRMKAFKLSDLVKVLIEEIGPENGLSRNEINVREIGLLKGEKLHEELATYEELAQSSTLPDMYILTKDQKRDTSEYELSRFNDRSSGQVSYLSIGDLSKLVHSMLHQESF